MINEKLSQKKSFQKTKTQKNSLYKYIFKIFILTLDKKFTLISPTYTGKQLRNPLPSSFKNFSVK